MSNIYSTLGGGRVSASGVAVPTPSIGMAVSAPSTGMSVDTSGLQLGINSSLQNIQTNVNTATAATTASVENAANQSTSLLTTMTTGATNLWNFLSTGFSALWSKISASLGSMVYSITSSITSSSSNMSFLERWGLNSIGMGFKLYGGLGTLNAQNVLGGPLPAGTDVVSGLGWNAKGNVFKGISDFSNSIVSSPTLFTYGEHLKAFAKGGVMGEAGPEAIMPLTRDGAGRLGVSADGVVQPCINNIYIETPEGYTAEQTSRVANDNGGEDIMFTIVKQTAANVAQPGSPMYRAMRNTFGASQVLTSR